MLNTDGPLPDLDEWEPKPEYGVFRFPPLAEFAKIQDDMWVNLTSRINIPPAIIRDNSFSSGAGLLFDSIVSETADGVPPGRAEEGAEEVPDEI